MAEEQKMYKRLLLLLDGSQLAEVAVKYASFLAVRLKLEVELLQVCRPEEAQQIPMREIYIEHMAEQVRVKSRAALQESGESAGVWARGSVVSGYPADEILKFAETHAIDLIMLATHGQSGIGRWSLGNVADKVIHAAKVPVWLVPAELREEVIYDQVVRRPMAVPLNGSTKAESILPYALALARQRAAQTSFVLIGVARPDEVPVSTAAAKGAFFNQVLEGTRVDKEVYLQGVVKRIQAAGFEAAAVILKGDPPEQIVKYVSEHPTQLIAMATNGASAISEFFFSNVTENVVRRLKKTPILLVRPR